MYGVDVYLSPPACDPAVPLRFTACLARNATAWHWLTEAASAADNAAGVAARLLPSSSASWLLLARWIVATDAIFDLVPDLRAL